ncbi:MAG: AMIN domain-containing protein, partial [Gammaproteobacteria bacterium]|nr:AMIN domain-containing protein [Gammaproteobacteria bacterium]
MNKRNTRHMTTKLFKFSVAGICLLGLGINSSLARELIGLDYSVMTGNAVQLVFTFDEAAVEPRTFTIDEPARIALDFADTDNGLKQRNLHIGIGSMDSIITAAANGRTRVVLNLTRKTGYSTSIRGNQLTLTLGESVQPVAVSVESDSTLSTAPQTTRSIGVAKGITKVDFKRGVNGEGRIIINMTSNTISTDIWRENDIIYVELIGAQLPEELQRRMDVSDFATPISFIDTIQEGANVKIAISTNTEFEHLAYQADKIYTIEVAPISKEKVAEIKKKKFGFTGERLSLNFQDIEVRSVLQLLADFTGLNLVVSDSV